MPGVQVQHGIQEDGSAVPWLSESLFLFSEVSGSEVQGPFACDLRGGWADVHVRRAFIATTRMPEARCEESLAGV